MPTLATALQVPVSSDPARVFARFKERLEKLVEPIFAIMTTKDRFAPMSDFISELSKRLEPQNRKRATEFSFVLAYSHAEAAEKFIDGDEFPNEDYRAKKDFIDYFLQRPPKGAYNEKFSRVVINLQAIKDSHEGDVKAQDACVVATSLHEIMHHISGMELEQRIGQHRFNIAWFVEGANELAARRSFQRIYPKEVPNLTCESCSDVVLLVEKIIAIVGEDVLFRAYLNGQFDAIITALGKEGVQANEIEELFRIGHGIMTRSKKESLKRYRQLSEYLDTLQRKRKGREIIERDPKDPGVSPTTIEAVRAILPEHQRDNAPRLVLGACLYYKVHFGTEPTAPQAFNMINATLAATDGSVPKAQQAFLVDATSDMQPIALNPTPEVQVLIPQTNPAIQAQKQQTDESLTADELSETLQALPSDTTSETQPVSLNQTAEVHTDEPRSDILTQFQSQQIEFGDRLTYDTTRLVEAATTQYMLQNDGALPSSADISSIINDAITASHEQEAIIPDPSIVTTQILGDTARAIQGESLASQDMWIREPVAEAFSSQVGADVLAQPYCAETKAQVAEILSSTNEFQGEGSIIADRCASVYSTAGLVPSCADVIGLAAVGMYMAQDAQVPQLESYMPEFTNLNPDTRATLTMLSDYTQELQSRARTEYLSQQPIMEQLQTITDFWERKTGAASDVKNLTGSTIMFAALLKIEKIFTKVACDPDSLVVAVAADGTIVNVGSVNYMGAMGLVGATGVTAPGSIPKMSLPKELADSTQYGLSLGETYIEITELPAPAIRTAENLAAHYPESYDRLLALFQILRPDGELGMEGSLFFEDRKTGSKSVSDVFRTKTGNCLELTMAYVAMAKVALADKEDITTFPVDVLSIETRMEVGHACVGVLIDDHRVRGYARFNDDTDFRQEVVRMVGIEDSPQLKMMLIDPVNSLFDCEFGRVVPLSENGLVSAFHFNSAQYAKARGASEEATREIKKAEEAWPENPGLLIRRALDLSETDPLNAIELLRRVEQSRREAKFYHALGRCQNSLGNLNAATACFDAGLRLDKTDEVILLDKSVAHLRAGTEQDHKKAETAAIQLIDILIEKRRHMSRTHSHASGHGKRLDEERTAAGLIGVQRRLINGYNLLGLTRMAQGKLDEACETYDAALAIHTNDTGLKIMKTAALCLRAVRHARAGRITAAKRNAQTVVSSCKRITKGHRDVCVSLMQGIATHISRQDKQLTSFQVGSNALGIHIEVAGRKRPEEQVDIRGIISSILAGWSRGTINLTPQQVEDILTPRPDFRPRIAPGQSITELGGRIICGKSTAHGRIKFDALEMAMDHRKQDTLRRLRILGSDLDRFEKTLLLGYLDRPSDDWVTLFVAVSHQELMEKYGIPRGEGYMEKIAGLAERSNPPHVDTHRIGISGNDLIELARFGLGERYAAECSRIAKLLCTDPTAIERQMLKPAVAIATRHLSDEHNIQVQTERYVQLLDLPPTPENIALYRPKVLELLASQIDLLWPISLIDPHGAKMG